MGLLCVATENGFRKLYHEQDIASACNKMRCGHHANDCLSLMRKKAMECVLCHAVLVAMRMPCVERAAERAMDQKGQRFDRAQQFKTDKIRRG